VHREHPEGQKKVSQAPASAAKRQRLDNFRHSLAIRQTGDRDRFNRRAWISNCPCLALAKAGAEVVLTARDINKGQQALNDVIAACSDFIRHWRSSLRHLPQPAKLMALNTRRSCCASV